MTSPAHRFDLATPLGRTKTYLDYLWNDHAYLRLGFSNAHWISEELVRANQPWPHQIADWKARGIKSIVNLRGGFDAKSLNTARRWAFRSLVYKPLRPILFRAA